MNDSRKKSALVVIRRSPYGSSLAKSSIDVALAIAAFEQPVDLLFMGDGVLQLHHDQDSRVIGVKNIGRQVAALPLYDINRVYVDGEAAVRFNLDMAKAPIAARALNPKEIHQLMLGYDHLLGF